MYQMKYVNFWNSFTDSMYDGFLVKEDIKTNLPKFYTIDPIVYEWVLKKGDKNWFSLIEPKGYEKEFYSYFEVPIKDEQSFMRGYDWLLDFPIDEKTIPLIPKIANFFEHFIFQSKDISLEESFKNVDSRTYHFVPDEVRDDIKKFIKNHFEQS